MELALRLYMGHVCCKIRSPAAFNFPPNPPQVLGIKRGNMKHRTCTSKSCNVDHDWVAVQELILSY